MVTDAIHRHFDPVLRRVPGIVVGVLDAGHTELAALGSVADCPAALCWEIGSITKVFTGLLLAEMSLRGEVRLGDPIGAHVPGHVASRLPPPGRQPTLADLATHTAGLPRVPVRLLRRMGGSDDPYSLLTEAEVMECLGPRTRRPRHPRLRYSNFGMGLLGHLLARAAGRPYGTLVEERILAPLGMRATGVGGCGTTSTPVQGFRKGRPTPAWSFGALAGAGGLRATVADLLTFAGACIDPPPGPLGEALELARRPFHHGRLGIGGMGLGWMLRAGRPASPRARTVWHNGGTYGASSFVAVDPARGRAVVALGNAGPRLVPPLDRPGWAVFDAGGA